MSVKITVGVVALPGARLLDVSGPLDVFAEANTLAGYAAYRLLTLGTQPGPIITSSGVRLLPDLVIQDANTDIDTLLIAGAPGIPSLSFSPTLLTQIRRIASKSKRYGSVCTGAFLLAEAGLLDGRRATTHWADAAHFAERFPAVKLHKDAIHTRDGSVWTSAGATAGLDLALALVEADLGRDIAKALAASFVMLFKRSGGQMRFSRKQEIELVGRSALQEIQRWAAHHPAADLSVNALAKRMGITPRHFSRLFRTEVGMSPAAWVESVRIEAARPLLEDGKLPKQVAKHVGYGDADTFRRAFARQLGVTPTEYRRQYGQTGT